MRRTVDSDFSFDDKIIRFEVNILIFEVESCSAADWRKNITKLEEEYKVRKLECWSAAEVPRGGTTIRDERVRK